MNDHISPESALYAERAHYNYTDSFAIPLHCSNTASTDLIPAFFQSAPSWVDSLFALRSKIVEQIGLQTGSEHSRDLKPPYQIGRRIGLFRIIDLNDQEVILGEDDRHLNFRTSLLLTPHHKGSQLIISTAVKTNNILGVVYFAVVKPFHRLIVPIMAKAMARRLDGTKNI